MAGTITKDLIDVSVADAVTGWSGTSGQLDTEAFKQGTGAFTYQTSKNGIGTCTFTPAANINMATNYPTPHLYWVMRCDVFPFTELLNTGATNSGLMVRVTDGAGNFTQWHIAGKDTWDGSWKNFILDLTNTANVHSTSGTLSLADVDIITWFTDNSNSGNIRIIDNTWIDAVRYGDGLIVNSTTTEAFGFQDIADDDALIANYYTVLQEKDGVLFCQGKVDIGQTGTTTNFVSFGETVYFLDRIVSTAHHALVGVPGTVTDIDITALVCKTVGTTGAELDFSDATLDSLSIVSSTFINMGAISFGLGVVDSTGFSGCGTTAVANSTMTSNTWIVCDAITITGTGTITNCNITTSAATSAVFVSDLADVITCHFVGDNTGHAVELTSIGGGSMNWDSTFDTGTYATVDGSTGNETIYVNVGTGTLTINVLAGATAPSIRTAGAVITVVVNPVTLEVTVKDTSGNLITSADVNVLIEAAAGGSLAVGTDIIKGLTNVSGVISDTRTYVTDQPITGWARKSTAAPFYKQSSIVGTISKDNGLVLTILMISDE